MNETISRVAVFSRAQRITHWLIGIGVMFQLLSAWLIQHANVDVLAWVDWHLMVGQGLGLVLLWRVALFFLRGSGYWRLFIPTREQRHVALQTIRFYASLGRLPCPDWYAYNPIWQPVYLLLYVVLLTTSLTGFGIGSGAEMADYHSVLGNLLLYFTLAHIGFTILHDVKGNGAQISAMLNGYKYFISRTGQATSGENSVSLESLQKKVPSTKRP